MTLRFFNVSGEMKHSLSGFAEGGAFLLVLPLSLFGRKGDVLENHLYQVEATDLQVQLR